MVQALQNIPNLPAAPASIDFSGSDSPGSASFGTDGTAVIETVQIDGTLDGRTLNLNIPSIIAGILGSVRSVAGALSRSIPWQHPLHTNCWASRISDCRGIGYIGKDKRTGLAVYKRLSLSVVFTVPKYKILPDGGNNDEKERWVIQEHDPYAEAVKVGVPMYFAPDEATPATLRGRPFRGEAAFIVTKCLGLFTWCDVPRQAILSNGWPTRTLNALGRVNAGAYMGQPQGTLLFKEVKIRSKVGPCQPRFYGLGERDVPVLLDLTYALYQFASGWNTVPGKDGTGVGWFRASFQADGTGGSFYKYADFSSYLFKAV